MMLVSDCSGVSNPEMEFDLDKALEEVPIHLEDPLLPPPPAVQPVDGLWTAPSSSSDLPVPPTLADSLPPLEHHTKSRPRPKRRTRPSRPAVGG